MSSPPEAESARPFESLVEMRAAYNNLAREYGEILDAESKTSAREEKTLDDDPLVKLLNNAHEFMSRGRETGTLLDDPDDRSDAQTMLNFWANILYRYRPAPGEEPPPAALSRFGSPAHAVIGDVPFQAPELPDVFASRNSFMADVKQQLLDGRSIVLCGPAGIGKTLIATKLAHDPELREKYPDGVLWARLGDDPDLSGILHTWGEALNVISGDVDWFTDHDHARKVIRQALGRRRMLLVIDNGWQSDPVLALKLGGPNCVHLVTTDLMSVALGVDAEGTVTVPGLEVSDGLHLLMQGAPEIVEAQEGEAKALVAQLDGSPLALSILANFCRVRAAGDFRPDLKKLRRILEEKQTVEADREAALSKGPLNGVQTLPSLLATIGWCVDQLGSRERYVLQAFSSFPPKPNSFSDAAARYITEEDTEGIEMLLDYGLLQRTPPDRYSLHRAVSDFLKRRPVLADHRADHRMVRFFVNLVKSSSTNYRLLEKEEKNILAAFETASIHAMWELVVEGTNALFPYFDRRGLYDLAKKNLNRARAAAESLNDERSLATILLRLGDIEERRSELVDAREHLKASFDIGEKLQDRNIGARALQGLGVVAMAQGEYRDAERYLNEALVLARETPNADIQCDINTRLGWLERGLGNFKESRARTQQALDLALANHFRGRIAELELSLGVLDFFEKNYESAKEHDLKGIQYAERVQDKRLQCGLHQALGGVEIELGGKEMERGDFARAEEHFTEAEAHLMKSLHLSVEIGHRWYNGVIWKEIGELRLKQQFPNSASTAFKKGFDLAREVNSPELMGLSLYGLARVAAVQRKYAEARLQGETSLNIFQSIGHHKTREVKEWIASLTVTV